MKVLRKLVKLITYNGLELRWIRGIFKEFWKKWDFAGGSLWGFLRDY